MISHRPSLLASTDKIAVLNRGNLVKFAGRDEVFKRIGWWTSIKILLQISAV